MKNAILTKKKIKNDIFLVDFAKIFAVTWKDLALKVGLGNVSQGDKSRWKISIIAINLSVLASFFWFSIYKLPIKKIKKKLERFSASADCI